MKTEIKASANYSGTVTKSDTTALDFDALYVGTTGDVVIKHHDSADATTYPAVPSGAILPVHGVRVMAATTASGIVWMRY